jgi:thymidine phosphorylase
MGAVLASVEGRELEPVDDVIDRLRRLVDELRSIPNISASISIAVNIKIEGD